MLALLLFIAISCVDNKNEYPCSKDYPDYYGGSYYDEDGRLAVLIVVGFNVEKKSIDSLVHVDDYYLVGCQYSYNDLLCVHKQLQDLFMDPNKGFIMDEATVNSLGINLRKNSVFVSLRDSSEKNITLFRKRVSDSPIISFEKWKGNIEAH